MQANALSAVRDRRYVVKNSGCATELSVGQVISWIYRPVVEPDFVMQVWRSAAAGSSHVSNDVIFAHFLTDLRVELRQVAKAGRQAIPVIDDEQVSISGLPLSINDCSVRRCMNLCSKQRGNIQPQVELRFSVKRIGAIAVMAADMSLDRPDRRSDPPNRGVLYRDLLQQRQLALQFRRSVFQDLDTVFRIRRTQQLCSWIVDFRTAHGRYVEFSALSQAVIFDKGLDLFEKALDAIQLLAEFDSRDLEILLLNFEIDVFDLQLIVIGSFESHFDVAESQSNCGKNGENAEGDNAVQKASWKL